MKKYLMMGAAVLAMSSAFVSCTKDTDLYEGYNPERLRAEYNAVFVNTFGEPAADQNWGFGPTSQANTTRAVQASFNFPSDADASKFLAKEPEGVEKLTANAASVNNFIDETWTGELNIWGQWDGSKTVGGTIYIKGTQDFSNRNFYIAPNTEIYLLEGATLTLNDNDAGRLQGGCNIYMAKDSKIKTSTTGELVLNNGLHIYNHGTIEANKLHSNSNSVLYNSGVVTITTKISVENDLSVIVNDGTITAADLNTAGSGKFENNGDVTITGTTFVNSNNNAWVNNGQYHTGNFIYNAASDDVINNCLLTVDEDFNMNLGDNPGTGNFKMDAGAGVVTRNFNGGGNWAKNYSTGWNTAQGGPFYIYMGENSVFKVTGTATMNATKANYGIYGPESGGYAVFEANKIVAGAANQGFEVTYGGNLYVYTPDHFANGNDGNASHPYIDIKGNAKIYAPGDDFNGGKPSIKIASSTCNPGFEGGDEPTLPSLCVLAEDLCAKEAGEFDFNDVVIDVYYQDANTVKIMLRAAGGTVPLRICGSDAWEVHKLFDVPVTCMVNTGKKYHVAQAPYSQTEKPAVELTYTGYSGWSDNQETFNTQVNHQIKLEVGTVLEDGTYGSWTELKAEVGKAAQKVAMPVDAYVTGWYTPGDEHWAWEKQYVGDGFKEWVIGQSNSFYLIRRR